MRTRSRLGTKTTKPVKVYIVGSLRNPNVPMFANKLRALGFEAFDDWFSAGPEADDCWRDHSQQRGEDLRTALAGAHAQDVFAFDKRNIDSSDAVILLYPAGKSAHLELGYAAGSGKETHIILDGEPDRYDVMLNFADEVWYSEEEFLAAV